jgi:raffinose/stachyose/melibiose transport system substrate-binding protein
MKKSIALILVLAMCLTAFAGCQTTAPAAATEAPAATEAAAAATEAPAPAEPVSLTVVTSYGGDDGNRANYEAALAGYEAATGNKVLDASATSNEEWKAKVMTDFETGTEPDVLFYFNGNDSDAIVSAGKVVSLDDIRAAYPEYATNMKDDMLVPSSVDGKIYSVPVNGYWESMYVNTKVLAAAGVTLPAAGYTWDQFLLDCQKIKDAGFTPVAVSLQEVPHYWFEFAVYNNGNTGNHLTLPAASTDETGMKWAKGLEDIKALYDAGYLPENTLTATDAETVQLMADGQAAFLIDGSWKIGFFQTNCADHLEDFALAYVPAKGERQATDLIGGISMGYYITKKAWDDPAKREAAVKFVEYMTSDEQVSIFSVTAVTALKNGVTPAANLDSLQKSAITMCAGATSVVGAVQDKLTAEQRGDLFANVKNIVSGKITAPEAIDSALAK